MKKNFLLAAVMILSMAMIWTSCKKDDEDDEPAGVTITGMVKNISDLGVKNATVTFTSSDKTATGQTDVDGNFELTGIPEGSYSVSIEALGYITTSESSISVSSGSVHNFDLYGSANVSGKVLNSQNGDGVEGVEVVFTAVTKSANSVNEGDFRIYSNSQGIYQMNQAPTGMFNVSFNSPGFFVNDIVGVSLTGGDNDLGESTVVEVVEEGEVRIVLTWGLNPYDLDTHLTGPTTSGERFHIYYVDQLVNDGSNVSLDWDDTNSYGPETITIDAYLPGTYRYSVHNFSDQDSEGGLGIYESPAKVEIFDINGVIASWTPKAFVAGSGNTWRVFEFSIANDVVSVTTLDDYVFVADEDDGNSFKSNEKKSSKFNVEDF